MIKDDSNANLKIIADDIVNNNINSSYNIQNTSTHERVVHPVRNEGPGIRENDTDMSVVCPPPLSSSTSTSTSTSTPHKDLSKWEEFGPVIRESLHQFLEKERDTNSVFYKCDLLLRNILPLDGEADYMSDITVHATFISTAAEYVHQNVLANMVPNSELYLKNSDTECPTNILYSEIFSSICFLDIGNAVLVSWTQIIRTLGASVMNSLLRSLNVAEVILLAECCLDALLKMKSNGNQNSNSGGSGDEYSDVIEVGNVMNARSERSNTDSNLKDDTVHFTKDLGCDQFHHVLRCIFLIWSERHTSHIGAKDINWECTLDRDSMHLATTGVVREEGCVESTLKSNALYVDDNVAEVPDLAVMLQSVRMSWVLIGYAELQSNSDMDCVDGSGKRKRTSNVKEKNKKKKNGTENAPDDQIENENENENENVRHREKGEACFM